MYNYISKVSGYKVVLIAASLLKFYAYFAEYKLMICKTISKIIKDNVFEKHKDQSARIM